MFTFNVIPNNIFAATDIGNNIQEIPFTMQPGSVIIYDDDLSPVIIKGGEVENNEINIASTFNSKEINLDNLLVDIPDDTDLTTKQQIELENSIAEELYNDIFQVTAISLIINLRYILI